MSLIRPLLLTLGVTLIASVATAKSPTVIADTVGLAEGEALPITVKMDELAICSQAPCHLWIGKSYKDDDKLFFLRMDQEGAWTLSGPNEHYSEDTKDDDGHVLSCDLHTEERKAQAEEEAEAEKEAEKNKTDEEDEEATPDDSWKDRPILSVEERRRRQSDRGVSKQFCIDKAAGTLAGEGNDRSLQIPVDLIPDGDFFVWSNGHFGAYVGDLQIGRPSKTGGIKFDHP